MIVNLRLKSILPRQKIWPQPRLKEGGVFGWIATMLSGELLGTVTAEMVQTAFQIGVLAVNLGLSLYSYFKSSSGKQDTNAGGVPKALDNNGQLVNSRQSSDPVRVVYGIVRSGGTWVFSKVSAVSNQILNNVVSWGEGEIEGLAPAIDSSPIFTGAGINDLGTGGAFVAATCSCDAACYLYTPCSCNMTCYVYN